MLDKLWRILNFLKTFNQSNLREIEKHAALEKSAA